MGRTTKLTPDSQKRIVDAIRLGATYELASLAGGIDSRNFRRWMERGRKSSGGPYFELAEAVNTASAAAAIGWLALIEKAAREEGGRHWTAAAWKLERRYPDMYGRVSRIDGNFKQTTKTSMEQTANINVTSTMQPDEAEAVVRILQEIGALSGANQLGSDPGKSQPPPAPSAPRILPA